MFTWAFLKFISNTPPALWIILLSYHLCLPALCRFFPRLHIYLFPFLSPPFFAPSLLSWILLLNLSIYCSDVLQHPRLPATRLCCEPDRGSSEQHGALGLRQGIQVNRKRHSCVQEDHLWLLHMGCTHSCLSGWGCLLSSSLFCLIFYSFGQLSALWLADTQVIVNAHDFFSFKTRLTVSKPSGGGKKINLSVFLPSVCSLKSHSANLL